MSNLAGCSALLLNRTCNGDLKFIDLADDGTNLRNSIYSCTDIRLNRINARIDAIQSDVRAAVDAIAEIGTIIRQVNELQVTIAGAVEEQSATTSEIGHNVQAAANGSGEIAKSVGGVAEAVEVTTAYA